MRKICKQKSFFRYILTDPFFQRTDQEMIQYEGACQGDHHTYDINPNRRIGKSGIYQHDGDQIAADMKSNAGPEISYLIIYRAQQKSEQESEDPLCQVKMIHAENGRTDQCRKPEASQVLLKTVIQDPPEQQFFRKRRKDYCLYNDQYGACGKYRFLDLGIIACLIVYAQK